MRDKEIYLFKHILLILILSIGLNANTIYQSVKYALDNSDKLKSQNIDIEIQDRYIAQAKSANYPTVDLNLYKKREKTEFQNRDDSINSSTNYSITLKQNIYNGGYDKNKIKMAQKDREIAMLEYQKLTQEVIYGAIEAHINLIETQKLLNIYKNMISKYKSFQYMANQKVKYGNEIDKLEVDIKLENAILRYLDLQNTYQRQEEIYREKVGISPYKLNNYIKIKKYLVKDISKINFNKINKDLLNNAINIEKSNYLIAQSNANFLPKIDITLKAYKSEPLVQTDVITDNQYSGEINIRYNLFNGGRDKITKEINRLKKLKLIINHQDILKAIKQKYYKNFLQFKYSQKYTYKIKRYIKNSLKKYNKYNKLFKLSSQKSILDMTGVIADIASAKEKLAKNRTTIIMSYINILLLQSKLTPKVLK